MRIKKGLFKKVKADIANSEIFVPEKTLRRKRYRGSDLVLNWTAPKSEYKSLSSYTIDSGTKKAVVDASYEQAVKENSKFVGPLYNKGPIGYFTHDQLKELKAGLGRRRS